MKKVVKMYRCYTNEGIKLYCNPHKELTEADETNVVFRADADIVTLINEEKAVQVGRVIYEDFNLVTDGNKVFAITYKQGDAPGRPTGRLLMIGEEVE